MFTGPWVSGSVETSPTRGPITVTSIYDPSKSHPVVTATLGPLDPELEDEMEEWVQWCWITDEDWEHDFSPDDLVPACRRFYDTYCLYDPDGTMPTPMSRFPAQCTPYRENYTPRPPPMATPSPIQGGVPENCTSTIPVKISLSANLLKAINGTLWRRASSARVLHRRPAFPCLTCKCRSFHVDICFIETDFLKL